MNRKPPTTIVLPMDPAKRAKLQRYLEKIKLLLPNGHRFNYNQVAILVEVFLLNRLFEEGLMVNVESAWDTIGEQLPQLQEFLKTEKYIFIEACIHVHSLCQRA